MNLDPKSKIVPIAQIAKDAGINLHWSPDNKHIFWTLGDEYFVNAVKDRFTFLPGSPEKTPELTAKGTKIGLTVKTDTPNGRIAFTNARIITMEDDTVIESGTIILMAIVSKKLEKLK